MFARLTRIVSKKPLLHKVASEINVPLVELNELLDILAEIFPSHDVALLRDLLTTATDESRLEIAANVLIEESNNYADKQNRLATGPVADWEKFRSSEYRNTVQRLLAAEYKGLSKSTIRTILLENNHDYARSRNALAEIASKSWRFNVVAWISRRKQPPFPVMEDSTGCSQVDDEIFALHKPERDAQSARDEELAREINEGEYAEAQALLECGCCFGDYAWEDIATCTNGHFFCRACLNKSVKEALYGQGNCLFPEKGSVRCISSAASPACEGFVIPSLLPHLLLQDIITKVEERFAQDQLRSSGLHLVRCPACSYAVTEDLPKLRPFAQSAPWLLSLLLASTYLLYLLLMAFSYLFPPPLVPWSLMAGILYLLTGLRTPRYFVNDAIVRVHRKRTGVRQLFQCNNPQCGMATCIDCSRKWVPFHDCRREDTQRLYIERAMSEAVKRTCPECKTSFVKTDGCNKLTCPCGYQMCYMCRADLRDAGYGHFCQHFRTRPGSACKECDRCDLYETEDEQAVAAAAAKRAKEEWEAGTASGRVSPELSSYTHNAPWVREVVERLLEFMIQA